MAAEGARRGILVAREHGDGHDAALYRFLGSPPSYRYVYSAETGRIALAPFVPVTPEPFRLEAEAEWPPLRTTAGWAHPDFRACLSRGRSLHLRAEPTVDTSLELVGPEPGDFVLVVGWLADPGSTLDVSVGSLSARLVSEGGCTASIVGKVTLRPSAEVRFQARQDLHLDYLELDRGESKKR